MERILSKQVHHPKNHGFPYRCKTHARVNNKLHLTKLSPLKLKGNQNEQIKRCPMQQVMLFSKPNSFK